MHQQQPGAGLTWVTAHTYSTSRYDASRDTADSAHDSGGDLGLHAVSDHARNERASPTRNSRLEESTSEVRTESQPSVAQEATVTTNHSETSSGQTEIPSSSNQTLRGLWFAMIYLLFEIVIGILVTTTWGQSKMFWPPSRPVDLTEKCRQRLLGTLAKAAREFSGNRCGTREKCSQMLDQACQDSRGFKGNSNVYGIGIRLSLYLQWITSLVGRHSAPHSHSTLADGYILISIFYCVHAYIYSSTISCAFKQELAILSQLFSSGFFCVYFFPLDTFAKSTHKSLGTVCNNLLRAIALAFFESQSLRRAIYMINGGLPQPDYPCTETSFFLSSRYIDSPLYGNFSLLRIAQFTSLALPELGWPIGIILFGLYASAVALYTGCEYVSSSSLVTIIFSGFSSRSRQRMRNMKRKTEQMLGIPKLRIPPRPKDIRTKKKISLALGYLSFILSIVDVELNKIHNGRISGVNNLNTSNQYLPLVYSAFICWPVWRDYFFRSTRSEEDHEPDNGGEDEERGIGLHDLPPTTTSETAAESGTA